MMFNYNIMIYLVHIKVPTYPPLTILNYEVIIQYLYNVNVNDYITKGYFYFKFELVITFSFSLFFFPKYHYVFCEHWASSIFYMYTWNQMALQRSVKSHCEQMCDGFLFPLPQHFASSCSSCVCNLSILIFKHLIQYFY